MAEAIELEIGDPRSGKALMPRLKRLLDLYPLYVLNFGRDSGFWEALAGQFGD